MTERGYANAVVAMQELWANAEREGVTIGLEVANRYESNVLNTTEQGLRFLGAPDATLHLDMELATSARRFVFDHLATATA